MMPVKNDNINWLGFSLSPHMKMESNTSSHPQIHHFSHSQGENGDFHSPFSVIPLKSDASFCIMQALSTSHSQGSAAKVEDFFGGAAMATNQFLSLDTAFYDQAHQLRVSDTQIPSISEGEFPCLKTWIDHDQALDPSTRNAGNRNVELQSLSLSMSPASQSGCITRRVSLSKKRGHQEMGQKQTVHRKSIDTFGQRTSQYRGVTRHRWTGRYEAHLWDNSCKKEGQTRKGRQVYLGGYDMEEKAARAYDLAALKYWGPSSHINFPLENYHQELEEMKNMSRQEYVAHLRRKSSGFSRGASMYRGVTRHHQHGRWQARIGRVAGNKDLYLGTFSTQEEAAEAYDIAAIKFRGVNAVTNFNASRYDVEKIMASNTLPTGEMARRNKAIREPIAGTAMEHNVTAEQSRVESIRDADDWKMLLHNQHQENVATGSLDVKAMSSGDYDNACFSAALRDLISIDPSQTVADESAMPVAHSNPSSLVTSLSSSSEASPERGGGGAPPLMISPSSNVNSWISTTAAHLPVFACWNDMSPVV